jgi:simple sugar transport system ATP-binding protein
VRDRGGGVLLVSEDLDELLRVSDRLLVMYRGRIVGQLGRAEFDAYRIGSLMAGAEG